GSHCLPETMVTALDCSVRECAHLPMCVCLCVCLCVCVCVCVCVYLPIEKSLFMFFLDCGCVTQFVFLFRVPLLMSVYSGTSIGRRWQERIEPCVCVCVCVCVS